MTRYFVEAEAELNEAARFYEDRQQGLGSDFLRVIEEAIQSFEQYPRRWPSFHGTIRRGLVPKYPYAIFYLPYHGEVIVVAIAHLSRNPTYWLHRLSNPKNN